MEEDDRIVVEEETKGESVQREIREVPKDVVTLYFENRQGMSLAIDDYDYYLKLRESIKLGSSLLPIEMNALKAQARALLMDEKSYLSKRNMDWYSEKKAYSISTGDSRFGTVTVRPEELKNGERWLLNQQAASLIRKIESLDAEICDALINVGLIQIESPENMIMRRLHGFSGRK